MSTIITPTLLRRYLKATGWTLADGAWTGTNERGEAGCGFPDAWIARDALDADVLARVSGSLGRALALCARLGMLAAAEYNITEARSLIDTPACFALQRVGEERLSLAGVDVDAWKAAQ